MDFHHFVINSRKKGNYKLVNSGKMDQTPVWFDMPSARKGNAQGEKTLSTTTTGHKKSRFTVVLSCLAHGTKVKAGDHFQAKEPAKVSTRRSCSSSPNDWKDEDGIKLWIEKVWKLQPGSLLRKRSLHVWDSFQAHLVDPAKDALCQTNTEDRLRERWTTGQ